MLDCSSPSNLASRPFDARNIPELAMFETRHGVREDRYPVEGDVDGDVRFPEAIVIEVEHADFIDEGRADRALWLV